MRIESEERHTGMGADHSTRLAEGGHWYRLSEFTAVHYHGRRDGFELYSLEVSPDSVWGDFHRSNSGRWDITLHRAGYPDAHYASMEDAERWLEVEGIPLASA